MEDMVEAARQSVVQIYTERASGTGFIVDSTGYVLTNEHVVRDGGSVSIMFDDGTRARAQVMATDAGRDLALLQFFTTRNLPSLRLAASTRIGETVVALGYPLTSRLGLNITITRGVVSAFRTFDGVDYVQTDTSLNPGNSGGPLLNAKGEVVGMNSSGIRDADGINFAISYSVIGERLRYLIHTASLPPTPTPTPMPTPRATPTPRPAPLMGPFSGSIEHKPEDGKIDGVADITWYAKDAVIAARFFNPYSFLDGNWASGFLLRNDLDTSFHLVGITSGGRWVHNLRLDGVNTDMEEVYSSHIAVGARSYNDILIYIEDDFGSLFVNDEPMDTLDLSGLTEGGWIMPIANWHRGDGLAGASTRYENFTINRFD